MILLNTEEEILKLEISHLFTSVKENISNQFLSKNLNLSYLNVLKKKNLTKKLIPNFSVSMVVSQHNEVDNYKPILEDSAKKIGLILSKKKHNNLKNR